MPENPNNRVWRFDYAKFKFCTSGDHFRTLYDEIRAAYALLHPKGDFSKFHKVNVFRNPSHDTYDYFIDIWGEAAGLVIFLQREPYFNCCKRLDVRATEWEMTEDEIMLGGQALQRTCSQYNINVYSTKEGTKRMGRDRGGKGFAIGSHKSDLRVTYYKRKSEKAAVEYQYSGQKLINCIREVLAADEELQFGSSSWQLLKAALVAEGDKRVHKVLEHSGIGTFTLTEEAEQYLQSHKTLL